MKGIYEIRHKNTGKVYIGSSTDVNNRFKQHMNMLKNNKHHCKKLQNDVNYWGLNLFEFSLLKEVLDDSELIVYEQYFISLHTKNNLYNYQKTVRRKNSYKVKQQFIKQLKAQFKEKIATHQYCADDKVMIMLIGLISLLNISILVGLIPYVIQYVKQQKELYEFIKLNKTLLKVK